MIHTLDNNFKELIKYAQLVITLAGAKFSLEMGFEDLKSLPKKIYNVNLGAKCFVWIKKC